MNSIYEQFLFNDRAIERSPDFLAKLAHESFWHSTLVTGWVTKRQRKKQGHPKIRRTRGKAPRNIAGQIPNIQFINSYFCSRIKKKRLCQFTKK